ncbi:hypothetical protein A0H76_2280 [Hepatospora eriocheir]|uniref:Integrase catalytic domain-containing protein n=1 Tax=Hepatospora eriocheir TaxID=1081669 RepID=A0A1X0QK11_9MICR|nr:hypothetical protein A0H76_2280 [Hepatospora eriocheir]
MFGTIGIDLIDPLPKTKKSNRFIVLATDYASSWVEGKAIKKKSAKVLLTSLLKIFLLMVHQLI